MLLIALCLLIYSVGGAFWYGVFYGLGWESYRHSVDFPAAETAAIFWPIVAPCWVLWKVVLEWIAKKMLLPLYNKGLSIGERND